MTFNDMKGLPGRLAEDSLAYCQASSHNSGECNRTLQTRELVPNPTFNRQRLCMTVLLVIIAVATFIAVLSYLAGDRQVYVVV